MDTDSRIVLYDDSVASSVVTESCVNTCPFARDGVCDDPREGNYCKLGTDCQDCGPVGADNFTAAKKEEHDGALDNTYPFGKRASVSLLKFLLSLIPRIFSNVLYDRATQKTLASRQPT